MTSSEDDYDMEFKEEVDENKANELRQLITDNPYNQQAHLELLDLLRSDLAELNVARKVFANIFTLSVDMWLEWISDLTISELDNKQVIECYLNALDQQKSARICSEFFEYLVMQVEDGNLSRDKALELMRIQLKIFAADFKESHLLYDIYLEFIRENTEECRAEYLKRLETLHMEIDSTFSNYSSFESSVQDNYDQRMKSASRLVNNVKSQCQKREEFEIRIKNGNLQDYLEYLEFEKEESMDRAIRIYERIVEIYYNDPYVWNSYVNYVFDRLKEEQVEKVIYRAVSSSTTCMVNCDLWVSYLYLIEKKKGNLDEIFQRGMYFTSGNPIDLIKLLVTRLTIAKRQLLNLNQLETCEAVNVNFDLQVTMAKLYCLGFDEKQKGYAVFDKILKDNNDIKMWLDYATTAITIKDYEKARAVFRNSVKNYKNNIDLLYTAWYNFEELYGSVDSIIKCRQILFTCRERDAGYADIQQETIVKETKKKRELEIDDELPERKKVKKEKKVDISQFKVIDSKNAGSMLFFGNLDGHVTENDIITVFEKYGKIIDFYMMPNPENGQLEAFLEYQDPQSVRDVISEGEFEVGGYTLTPQRCRPAELKWKFKNQEEKDTVYVSNLSININKIILRQHFGYFGKIKDIRLQYKGKSAFAYVQFARPEEAKESCKLNETEIEEGRNISVAISNPLKKTFHEADEKVLYVTNLSNSILEQDLENLFSTESAKKALQLNGTRLDNRYITVSVADPNIRRKKDLREPATVKPTTLVPRAVGRSHQKNVLKAQKVTKETADKDLKPKTQDDFRKMLLGNK
ncbi:Splicing factor [Boothiomyces sp. JEL0838]|nr:Splicing factor [Boothiomyces sp. JEL0838]